MTDTRTTPSPSANAIDPQPPLAGLTVIELHAIGPVPFAGQLLRSLGAEVIRVSPPTDRGVGVPVSPEHDLLNRGKTPLALDLKSAAGRAELEARLQSADVLLEGFRPGVLERLGLAPDALLARCPRLIVGRLSGWGSAGPLAPRAGHDINYLALSGVLNAIGKDEQPVPPLNLVADFGGGAMYLLVGVLARLARRGIDGRGGLVETSILAGTVGLTPMFYGLLASGRWTLDRHANLLDGACPFYRTYRCADGRFVAVGALESRFWRELLDLLELGGDIDPSAQYQPASWPATTERLERRFAERTRDEWAAAAESVDACLSPVLDFLEAARHPHNLSNQLYANTPFPHPDRILNFGAGVG